MKACFHWQPPRLLVAAVSGSSCVHESSMNFVSHQEKKRINIFRFFNGTKNTFVASQKPL